MKKPERLQLVGGSIVICIILLLAMAPQAARAEWQYTRLKSFGNPTLSSLFPGAAVIQGKDGSLYGTTVYGGAGGGGTVFKLNENGTGFRVLHHFPNSAEDGHYPYAKMLEGSDGSLFGTTRDGGTSGKGTVFKILADGSGYEVLHSFASDGTDGTSPYAELIEGSDGFLYGTTAGDPGFRGAIFRLGKDGSQYEILHWGGSPAALIEGIDGALYGSTLGGLFRLNKDGSCFQSMRTAGSSVALIQDASGVLYGVTTYGGTEYNGTIFRINPDGSDYELLHNFTGREGDGSQPSAALLEGPDGMLYGTTSYGGDQQAGAIFRLSKDGSEYRVVYSFGSFREDGWNPVGPLISRKTTTLIGTTRGGGDGGAGSIFRIGLDGKPYKILYSFLYSGSDGAHPEAALTRGFDGVLYGSTLYGGVVGLGTVFKIQPDGTGYQVLWSPVDESSGAFPYGVVADSKKPFVYGTTYEGGISNKGTIFRLSKTGGGYKRLHTFLGRPDDGSNPASALIIGSDDFLYGTCAFGGSKDGGSIFKSTKDGQDYSTLHVFGSVPGDGAGPEAPLLEGSDGVLYGTTWGGGSGAGTAFKLKKDGTAYQILHQFASWSSDGAKPLAALMEASDGKLYGTTYYGGFNGAGVLFRLNRDGSNYEVLREFASAETAGPAGVLVEGNAGELYGMTFSGGLGGTVYQVNKNGNDFLIIHGFTSTDRGGAFPMGGLFQFPDGTLYGTTTAGGDMYMGTVFRLSPVIQP